MKMTPLLWRVVTVWLCVAVVCRYPSFYVGCTEPQQEPQRPVSSQDVGTEEDSGEESHHQKVEESPPAQPLPESVELVEDDHQKEEPTTQEVDNEYNLEAFDAEIITIKEESEEDKGISQTESEHELDSENQPPGSSIAEEQQPAFLLPSSDLVSAVSTELIDDLSTLNPDDNIPNSVPDVSSDETAPEVTDSDLPPADCEEENNPYDNDSPPIVLENSSNAHTTGTHTAPPLSPPASQSSPHLDTNTSHGLKEQDPSSSAAPDTDSSVSAKDPEDIPTFDEWKRKEMEVEKEKTQSTHTSNNGAATVVKKVQKNFNNYASVECGAKILGSNPEAKSTSAILMENMDLYMLNPCSNKIWFIIELCEPIQVKQLDIANFELFSSTPKDFLVSISDRYPTNKWLKLGTFHGRDERTVQSFPLDEHLYAKYVKMFTKYIKVELLSHFGSEHFCPLSLIRVFGTSMVEEYDDLADPPERPEDLDDDSDYPPGYSSSEVKLSKNLIGSAKDVILNMVNNIAVNVLGGTQEMQGNLSSQEVNMTEPSTQLETASPTPTTDFTLVPDHKEEEVLSDPDIPPTVAPSSETPEPETPAADISEQELPPVEESIITPVEKDQEAPISSTIILLDKEEELDEEKEEINLYKRRQEIKIYCSILPSISSSCSCAASLQEYLHRQCSALLSKKRKCQTINRKQIIPPIQTPIWLLPTPPSSCLEPQKHHSEVHQPHEKEQVSEQEPESGASTSQTPPPPPPDTTAESHSESMFEPPLLEPSQTPNLPTPSATDSSSANPTPIVETPQLSSEEPSRELRPEKSQDVLDEEKHAEPSASLSSSSINTQPSVSASVNDSSQAPAEEKSDTDAPQLEIVTPVQIPEKKDQTKVLSPADSPHPERYPDPPAVTESSTTSTESSHPPDIITELEPSTETKTDNFAEEMSASSVGNSQLLQPSTPSSSAPSLSDIYADPPNGTEQNGNQVHGSSQKESVFMRLNNRIKALEMNMSLSGRYLEQLSQRYRKQMEEMQKAFNKTIIKLQHTSRIAGEQDQRQTESIQMLQGQLENMTQLVLNLSVRVSQLQNEVSDHQLYLLLSLGLCVLLGLLLFAKRRCISTIPPTPEPEPPLPKSYCQPERQFSSCDEAGLKRSASYPLIHSESFQLDEDPENLHSEETQSLCPANRKRRRRRLKPVERVETLKPSLNAAPELCNGAVICNGLPVATNLLPLSHRLLQPLFRDSPSEGSSEGSSHSDDPSFCGITTACPRICDGLPPPKTRAEKRALRRRRPKPSCAVVDFLQAPRRDKCESLPISTIQDLMNRKTEQSSGTFGVNVALSGPV
ncbi:SUN domain-containing ossification factor-like isoform X2 [Notolabrus celidotus]|uniref:SUN domain-containing ossification factor-like isoform X2 n=1 Tax=Notolabrus celidotus TaxID=1203425 RepID=UPI00148FCD74|nr:SUN domain-containing ossification factor-like isoform X2 [Notolabrus celidotus]